VYCVFFFRHLPVCYFLFFSKREVILCKVREMKTSRTKKSLIFTKVIVKSSRKTISMSFACVSVLVASRMMRSVLIYTPLFFLFFTKYLLFNNRTLQIHAAWSNIVSTYIPRKLGHEHARVRFPYNMQFRSAH